MKRIDSKKKVLLSIAAATLMVISGLCYWSFVQMDNIDVEAYWGNHFDDSMHDRIQVQLTRFQLYPNCWFIHKGDTYTNIPFHDEDSIQRIMDIKFNWNNTITVSERAYKYDINVDKIEIEPEMYHPADIYSLIPETEDSIFSGILFLDDKNNGLEVLRQKRMLPYKGRRIAFRFIKDQKVYSTGNESLFNY